MHLWYATSKLELAACGLSMQSGWAAGVQWLCFNRMMVTTHRPAAVVNRHCPKTLLICMRLLSCAGDMKLGVSRLGSAAGIAEPATGMYGKEISCFH